MAFSFVERDKWISKFERETYDLIIIGGGITGAGVARDAASRGMKVALIEARDFAFGTSSRSSKLIHGGIRYLENLEFRLVFEALSERRLLFENAPHLVHPLRFVLPLYRGGRVGMFKMGLGMWLYDALSLFEAPEPHERLSASETMLRLPLLKESDLLGSYVYSDAYMDDDRLVLETLRSAADFGAEAVNYVRATGAIKEASGGRLIGVLAEDVIGRRPLKIFGRHIISTVGPWTDELASRLIDSWKNILRPSKGVHLTFSRDRIPLQQAVVMAADHEKRIVFGIPRHEMVIVGTTDTDFQSDPSEVTTSSEDVSYLLRVANEYFPGAKLTADDIIATYAGVRPLVDDGSESESKTSREHLILRDPRNVTFVAGGKYTTYRRMAEETVEVALEAYSVEEQVRFQKPNTKLPLNPLASLDSLHVARRNVSQVSQEFAQPESLVSALVERHALETESILERLVTHPLASRDLPPTIKLWMAEVLHAVEETMCLSLCDFYFRRSPLFLSQPDHGVSMLPTLARVMQSALGWNDQQKEAEIQKLQELMQWELGWKMQRR